MFSFRQLECFVAVAEELHFGHAAVRLQIGQPPLSQQIRRLESDLGVRLLNRTRRSVELTEAGRVFLAQARLMLDERRRSLGLAQRAARGEFGAMRVALVPSGEAPALAFLRRFSEHRPDVKIDISILTSAQQLEALRGGTIDAGFVRAPVTDQQLASRIIAREGLIVAVRRNHPLGRSGAIALRELGDQPIILFPRRIAPEYYDRIVSLFHRSGAALNIVQHSEHVQTMLSLVAAGFGLAILADSVRACTYEDVGYHRLSGAASWVETALVWRRDHVTEIVHGLLAVADLIQNPISQTA